MPARSLSYEEVVDRLARVFREHGYEAATLKKLSEATGLGRSSLYHHFPKGKMDMGAAVLQTAGDWLQTQVIDVLNGPGAPRTRAQKAAQKLFDFYDGGRRWCLVELFALGEAYPLFGAAVARVLDGIKQGFAEVARDAGASPSDADQRAEEALMALQGALVLSRARGAPETFVRVVQSLPDRLLKASPR